MKKLNAKNLRNIENNEAEIEKAKIKRNPIFLILENIYDTYNIGGFFRLGDAVACEKIFICGKTDTPPNPKIRKASIGTYKLVPWEYKKTALEAITELRKIEGITIIAIEQHPKSLNYTKINFKFPIAFLLGNESFGIEERTLEHVDQIAEIPMYGINKSLNVMVAAGIVMYCGLNKASLKN